MYLFNLALLRYALVSDTCKKINFFHFFHFLVIFWPDFHTLKSVGQKKAAPSVIRMYMKVKSQYFFLTKTCVLRRSGKLSARELIYLVKSDFWWFSKMFPESNCDDMLKKGLEPSHGIPEEGFRTKKNGSQILTLPPPG